MESSLAAKNSRLTTLSHVLKVDCRVGRTAYWLRDRKTDEVLRQAKAPLKMSEMELAKVKRIATNATVRLVSKERLGWGGTVDEYDRWSGVIVSDDGYILTAAHTGQLPGEKLTVHLSDGRDADAVALGTNEITDIGLAKITTPGSWPFAEIADSSTLKPDEPVVSVGYPYNRVLLTACDWLSRNLTVRPPFAWYSPTSIKLSTAAAASLSVMLDS